jgi:hypothetical protein
MWQVPLIQLLTASVIAGIIGFSGFFLTANIPKGDVVVSLESAKERIEKDEQFVVHLVVESSIPTNVFKGTLRFDTSKIGIVSIDYNTSLADLWAEEPWYSNGDGTLTFTGGTTRPGGFVGKESLISITFVAKDYGKAALTMSEMRILRHDGTGSEVPLPQPIDALFAVEAVTLEEETISHSTSPDPAIYVVKNPPSLDLNGDGKQSVADVSIFMTHFLKNDLRSDFNQDGKVDLKDFSILNN